MASVLLQILFHDLNSSDILDDSQQVLFTRCDFAGSICEEIVPAIFADTRCHLHTKLQPVVYHYSGCDQDVCHFCIHYWNKHLMLAC